MERRETTINDLCQVAPSVLDGLPARCVGEWAYDKIYMLVRYLEIFANGMKSKWQGNLNYIEICSGPGRCIRRDSGEELDGTALAIVRSPAFQHIKRAIFLDNNRVVIETLNRRLTALHADGKCSALVGDYTDGEGLCRTIGEFGLSGLNLLFLDPTDCSVPFSTVASISRQMGKVDLIINVAIGTDVTRNIKRALTTTDSGVRSKYAAFLGSEGFFLTTKNVELARNDADQDLRLAFVEEYRKALQGIGLVHFDAKKIRHYYYLVFASAAGLGLDFWRKINLVAPDEQRLFF